MWNIPFNGLSVVLDASTDELLADAGTRTLVADLMDEVIAAAGGLRRTRSTRASATRCWP